MKIELIVVGKTATPYLKEGIEHYVKRLTHYVPYEIRTISDIKTSKALTAERQKEMEGGFILQQIQPGDRVVLLDEHGREMTSREFAAANMMALSERAYHKSEFIDLAYSVPNYLKDFQAIKPKKLF